MAAAPDPVALWNTTNADLGRQATFEEAKIGETLGFTESDVTRAENELTRQEPGVYRGEANRANKGGIMTSGINARRKGEIAANFGAKRGADQARLERARAEAKKAREGVGIKKETGEHTAAERRALGESNLTAQNPGVEPNSAPQTAPTGNNGWVGKVRVGPGTGFVGNVRVGGTPRQPPLSATRYYNPTTRRWETRI